MELSSNNVDTAVVCFDPDCGGVAEPEQDGDHSYYACTTCGVEGGYRKPQTVAVAASGACAMGIPEALRLAASAGMESALAAQDRTQLPLLQIGHRRDA